MPELMGLLVLLVFEVLIALGLEAVARGQHGLSGGRATVAGWAPFGGLLGVGGCCAAALGAATTGALDAPW